MPLRGEKCPHQVIGVPLLIPRLLFYLLSQLQYKYRKIERICAEEK